MTTAPSASKKKTRFKEFNSEFDDLDPVITYRHLQTPIVGPKHPLRFIALCDCNAFYANCEQVRLGLDPAKPLVVLQWNALIAVNYPAREYGISRMDKLEDALKRCPDLAVVHVATYALGETEPKYWDKPDVNTHKISLDLYRRESVRICNLMKELLPSGEVEKASVDESFIDLSMPVRNVLLERYQYLADPPPNAELGLDTPLPPPPRVSFSGLGNLIPIDPSLLDKDTKETTEAVEEAEKELPVTWHDVGLQIAAELMAHVRKEVHERMGYLTSAGIARNKFLAKLGASYRKFNTQNILRNAAIPGFLRPMPFQKIRFLGGKLGKALADEYDVASVGDLLSVSIDEMQSKFGECSVWVYEILRGIDRSEVKEKASINRSMNASKNLKTPIRKPSEGPYWYRMLAAELAVRLNEARGITPGLWPKTLALSARFGWGYNNIHSRQQSFPHVEGIVTVDFVTNEASKLWKELVGTDATMNRKKSFYITNISLGLKDIGWTEDGQQSIQGFFGKPPALREEKFESDVPLDLDSDMVPGSSKNRRSRSVSLMPKTDDDDVILLDADDDDLSNGEKYSFTCPRCRKILEVPNHLQRNSRSKSISISGDFDEVKEARERALASLRTEHDDWHFARDLSRADNIPSTANPTSHNSRLSNSSSSGSIVRRRKRGRDPEGIAKYFVKKRKN